MLDTEWMNDGACREADPELFHPEKGAPTKAAKKICNESCDVRLDCLIYALEIRASGLWGGLSERERRRLSPQDVQTLRR